MARTQTDPRPIHPGEVLRKEYLEPRGLTQRELAHAIHVPYQRVNELVRGKRGVTPSTALRLSRFLGTSAKRWLDLQARWDLYYTEQAEESELAAIELGAFSPEQAVQYAPVSTQGNVIKEARAEVTMGTQIQLPSELLAVLNRRGQKEGLSLTDQVIEMVRAFLQSEVDPILQSNDPLLAVPVTEGSGLGDLAADHDRYLYRKEGQAP